MSSPAISFARPFGSERVKDPVSIKIVNNRKTIIKRICASAEASCPLTSEPRIKELEHQNGQVAPCDRWCGGPSGSGTGGRWLHRKDAEAYRRGAKQVRQWPRLDGLHQRAGHAVCGQRDEQRQLPGELITTLN